MAKYISTKHSHKKIKRKTRYKKRHTSERMYLKMYRVDSHISQHGRCHYCLTTIKRQQITADHIIPQSKGGTTTNENIVSCCKICNEIKGATGYEEFMDMITNLKYNGDMKIIDIHIKRHLTLQTDKSVNRIKKYFGVNDV